MTDTAPCFTDFAKAQAERAARARSRLEGLKRDVLAPLRDAGVATVEILFDGYGDSGGIEEVVCLDADNKPDDCPEVALHIGDTSSEIQLDKALEDLAYLALELHHPGWENNEGAGGSLEIDVDAGTFTLECRMRFIDYDEHSTQL